MLLRKINGGDFLEIKPTGEELENRRILESIELRQYNGVLIDLTNIGEVNSHQIDSLLKMRYSNIFFGLINPCQNILETLMLLGKKDYFKIYQNKKEALKDYSGIN